MAEEKIVRVPVIPAGPTGAAGVRHKDAQRVGQRGYWNWTPIRVPFAQTTLQVWRQCSVSTNANVDGMPTMLSSSRQAPVSERLRTVQATAHVPRKIFPDFNIRLRGDMRRSSICAPERGRILDTKNFH
jgi:hypothetical protein